MIGACRWCLCLGLVLPVGVFARKPDAGFTVQLYNYARVSVQTMTAAKHHASRVFRAAGITVSWVDCPISDEDADRFRQCSEATKPLVVLRIVPPSMNTGHQQGLELFGVASDASAHVFSERVQHFAKEHDLPAHEVMGAVMAHELGHVLLGADSHSSIGIMRPKWRQEDFKPANGSSLLFTGQQIKLMKATLMNGKL